jgi:hypothetical protein
LDRFPGELSYGLPLLIGFGCRNVDHSGRLAAMGSVRRLEQRRSIGENLNSFHLDRSITALVHSG